MIKFIRREPIKRDVIYLKDQGRVKGVMKLVRSREEATDQRLQRGWDLIFLLDVRIEEGRKNLLSTHGQRLSYWELGVRRKGDNF